jgi:hypothetical protein
VPVRVCGPGLGVVVVRPAIAACGAGGGERGVLHTRLLRKDEGGPVQKACRMLVDWTESTRCSN